MNTLQSPPDPNVLARAAAKVKRHVLPLFVVMFIVNYIDRVNIGFVRSHMETDLGIGAAAYGLGAGLFLFVVLGRRAGDRINGAAPAVVEEPMASAAPNRPT